jgi:hypothetical protein
MNIEKQEHECCKQVRAAIFTRIQCLAKIKRYKTVEISTYTVILLLKHKYNRTEKIKGTISILILCFI